jgi:YegS/Rv2252/BmrU family lipid kinase
MRALLLYNPTAGRVPMRYFVASAVRTLQGMGWEAEMSASRSGVDGTEIARQAAEDGVDVVFAVGGDGTIRGVAAGLAGSRTALGILPAGTMNVFAFELGLRPFTWYRLWAMTANARKLAAARAYDVDVGRCGKEEFLLWAGIGLDAVTIQQLEPRPRLDKFFTIPHYAAQVVWNAAQWHGLDMRFRADGEDFSGRFLLAVVANIRKYMGGYVTISPNARLDDGEMDLWLFSGEHIGDTARHLVDMATQRHPTSVKVQRVPFRHLEVESDTPYSIQMDGDPAPGFKRVEIDVLPRCLRLLVPEQSPAFMGQLQRGSGSLLPDYSPTPEARIPL